MAIVLVTGGSSGIGLATVRRLAQSGDIVFAASRDPRRAELPHGVSPIEMDLTDPASAPHTIAAVVGIAGGLDVLVNNAGAGTLGPLEETTDEEAHHTMEVNLFGPLRLARAAIPIMRDQGAGRIVNVTSMNDILPAPFGGWYSASKAALASASAVLDAEVHGFGISVTVIAPGLFRTDMTAAFDSQVVAENSSYRSPFECLRAQNVTRMATAADPDLVAVAIEQCIRAADPPARVVVGADAELMAALIHDTSPDDFARLLRDFVASLGSG